MSTVTIY